LHDRDVCAAWNGHHAEDTPRYVIQRFVSSGIEKASEDTSSLIGFDRASDASMAERNITEYASSRFLGYHQGGNCHASG
jgi:hypothetical protein